MVTPEFSIILPTHNRSSLLKRAIQSVLVQSFKDFQLIIVDDGSTDKTREVVSAINDHRIVYIYRPQSRGVSAARNSGIDVAKGKSVSFLDDDDEYLPNFLEETRNFLQKSDLPLQFVWGGIRVCNWKSDGSTETTDKIWHTSFATPAEKERAYLAATEIACAFGVTIERQCFTSCGIFDETLKISEDSDLFLRLLARGKRFRAIPKVLVKQNVHQGESLSRSIAPNKKAIYNQMFINKNKPFLQQHPYILNRYQAALAGTFYEAGNRPEARRVIQEILARTPLFLKAWELFFRFEVVKRFRL